MKYLGELIWFSIFKLNALIDHVYFDSLQL